MRLTGSFQTMTIHGRSSSRSSHCSGRSTRTGASMVVLTPPSVANCRGARHYDPGMALELGRVTDRRPPFKYSALARVWFSDTDAQGIVYYGRYLPYFDHARVEYHRHLGLGGSRLDVGDFVTRASDVEYHAPARFDDLLEIFVRLARIGRTSATYDCAAYRMEDDALMVTAKQTLVLVDLEQRRAIPIPDWYVERMQEFEGDD